MCLFTLCLYASSFRPLRLGQQRKFNLLPVEDTAVFWDLLKRVKQTTSELQLQCKLCYSSLHPCKQTKKRVIHSLMVKKGISTSFLGVFSPGRGRECCREKKKSFLWTDLTERLLSECFKNGGKEKRLSVCPVR